MAHHPEYAAGRDLRQVLLESHGVIREIGADGLLDRIASGLTDRRYQELAYTLASRVVAADGKTAPGEAAMLRGLQERFGFSEMDVLQLLA
jgi:hypothetical protein